MKNLKHLSFLFLLCLCLFSTNGAVLAMNDTIVNNDTIVAEEIRCGILRVNTVPKKAVVYIDSVYRGQTPLMLADMLPGEHIVTIENDGYFSKTKTALVVEGWELIVNETLNSIFDFMMEQYNMGVKLYEDADYAKAIEHFYKAIEYGHVESHTYIGECYHYGTRGRLRSPS